jgi:allophanate hydrolase
VAEECLRRLNAPNKAFIFKVLENHVLARAREQDSLLATNAAAALKKYPLLGVPFAVKDNIDVAGFPTTCGCPAFSYTPWESSPVVGRLMEAGAVLMGKTNMDQFAAGLVGVRSPYGVAVNPFNAAYVPGGSSSGSGVAVSTNQVVFAVGTDTAGSGRVPAAFTNTVGLKPTRGLVSTRGLFPACRSLDCLSVFALTCEDAWDVFSHMKAFDPADDFARPEQPPPARKGPAVRFGVPAGAGLAFFGDTTGAAELFHDGRRVLQQTVAGSEFRDIDFRPFTDVARVLYEGPWTAERLSALDAFFATNADDFFPVTRGIMQGGAKFSAVDTFKVSVLGHFLFMFV